MGLKLSCIHRGSSSLSRQAAASPAPARVIAADGSLKEFPASTPTRVSDVLGRKLNGVVDVEPALFFVCDSDALYFNEHPPALAPGELLRPGQIYFVLPTAMLEKPLSTAYMAALAVRASTALLASSSGKARRRARPGGGKKQAVRVMPVREEMEDGSSGEDVLLNEKLNQQTLGEFGASLTLSPTKKKDEKIAAAAAATRLKRALSIIQEDAE